MLLFLPFRSNYKPNMAPFHFVLVSVDSQNKTFFRKLSFKESDLLDLTYGKKACLLWHIKAWRFLYTALQYSALCRSVTQVFDFVCDHFLTPVWHLFDGFLCSRPIKIQVSVRGGVEKMWQASMERFKSASHCCRNLIGQLKLKPLESCRQDVKNL